MRGEGLGDYPVELGGVADAEFGRGELLVGESSEARKSTIASQLGPPKAMGTTCPSDVATGDLGISPASLG